MRKGEKERARDTAKSWTAVVDAAHGIRCSGCCGCCPSFAMLDGWLRMTLHCADGATLNHRGGSVGKRATRRF